MPLWIWLVSALLLACLFCWYISPDRRTTPGRIQKVVAVIWIIFRRIVSFTAAGLGIFCVYILWSSSYSLTGKIFGSLAVVFLSIFFVYVGIVGQGWSEHSISDDLSLYAKIKNKYGIRW